MISRVMIISISLFLCLTASVATAASGSLLADRLPNETLVYIGWAGRTPAFDGSMMGQLIREPAFAEVVKTARKSILENIHDEDAQQTFQQVWDMLAIAWERPMALAMTDLRNRPGGSILSMPSAVILIDLGDKKDAFATKLETLLTGQASLQFSPEDVNGTTVYSLEGDEALPLSYGYIGNIFFLTFGPDMPEKLMKIKPADSLNTNRKFAARITEVSGENEQMLLYVDVTALGEAIDRMSATSRPATMPAGQSEQDPARKAIKALGFSKVDAIAMSMRVVDKGFYSKLRLFTPAPHEGLLKLFAGKPLNNADLSEIPADADFFAAVRVSPLVVYREIRNIVYAIGGESADRQMSKGVGQFENRVGISLERDLLAPLGDKWMIVSAPSYGGFLTGTVLIGDVKDPNTFRPAVGKLEDYILSRFASRPSYDGGRGYYRRPPMQLSIKQLQAANADIRYAEVRGQTFPFAPAWTVCKDKFYLAGWPQVVQSAVQPQKFAPITKNTVFNAFRRRVAAHPTAIAYVNTPRILRQNYHWLLLFWTIAANMGSRELDMPLQVDWLPTLQGMEKYLWPMISTVSADDGGITFEGYSSLPMPSVMAGPLFSPVTVAVLLPALGKARHEARKVKSVANIRCMGMAIVMYKMDKGRPPAQLGLLVTEETIRPEMLVSPTSGRQPPKVIEGKIVGEIDYIYFPLDNNAPSDLLMAYERPENYRGEGTVVLYADGAAAFVDMSKFHQDLKRTQDYIAKQKAAKEKAAK